MKRKPGKRKLKVLEKTVKNLETGVQQIYGSIWYFQNDASYKGYNWAYSTKELLKSCLEELEKAFPDEG